MFSSISHSNEMFLLFVSFVFSALLCRRRLTVGQNEFSHWIQLKMSVVSAARGRHAIAHQRLFSPAVKFCAAIRRKNKNTELRRFNNKIDLFLINSCCNSGWPNWKVNLPGMSPVKHFYMHFCSFSVRLLQSAQIFKCILSFTFNAAIGLAA